MAVYWLGIMVVAFAVAITIWITLVMRAGRKSPEGPQAHPPPNREIVGGMFEARRGGRQVMPDPYESIVHEPAGPEPEQAGQDARRPAASEQATGTQPPEYGKHAAPGQAPARGDRP